MIVRYEYYRNVLNYKNHQILYCDPAALSENFLHCDIISFYRPTEEDGHLREETRTPPRPSSSW